MMFAILQPFFVLALLLARVFSRARRGLRVGVVVPALVGLTASAAAKAQTIVQPTPRLAGIYQSRAEHPRVFVTAAMLRDLAARIATRNSYSAQRFSQLAERVRRDLAANAAWDATYAGCNIETYLYAFSYEPHDASETAKLQADLHLTSSTPPPSGVAVVASRLALYAALAKAGAPLPPHAPSAERAANLATRILLAWSDHGFRDMAGHFLSSAANFCGPDGKIDAASMTAVGLQISRGVVYSVHAQDLLMYLGSLDVEQARRLTAFHVAMFDLIRHALNYRFADHPDWACNHYSNHVGSQLTGLLTIARLLNDKARFDAVLYGNDPAILVKLPWTAYFDKAIYGVGDRPNTCDANTGPDGLTSRPFFQTADVVQGEIDDRYRNANPLQGIGYAMATLEWLYDMAEIQHIAGFDPYGYRGVHGQSIEEATSFYAIYARAVGFGKVVTAANAGGNPDFAQYDGKVVNGADSIVVRGAQLFPNDTTITGLEVSAKLAATSEPFSSNAVTFGQWRD